MAPNDRNRPARPRRGANASRATDGHDDDIRDVNEPVDKTKRAAALSALLDREWDPIGVYAGVNGAPPPAGEFGGDGHPPAGEYGTYVPGLLTLLDRGATTAEVAWHLRDLAHQQMGLPPSGRENEVADLLRRWHTLWNA